jgi:hypothetical protein
LPLRRAERPQHCRHTPRRSNTPKHATPPIKSGRRRAHPAAAPNRLVRLVPMPVHVGGRVATRLISNATDNVRAHTDCNHTGTVIDCATKRKARRWRFPSLDAPWPTPF